MQSTPSPHHSPFRSVVSPLRSSIPPPRDSTPPPLSTSSSRFRSRSRNRNRGRHLDAGGLSLSVPCSPSQASCIQSHSRSILSRLPFPLSSIRSASPLSVVSNSNANSSGRLWGEMALSGSSSEDQFSSDVTGDCDSEWENNGCLTLASSTSFGDSVQGNELHRLEKSGIFKCIYRMWRIVMLMLLCVGITSETARRDRRRAREVFLKSRENRNPIPNFGISNFRKLSNWFLSQIQFLDDLDSFGSRSIESNSRVIVVESDSNQLLRPILLELMIGFLTICSLIFYVIDGILLTISLLSSSSHSQPAIPLGIVGIVWVSVLAFVSVTVCYHIIAVSDHSHSNGKSNGDTTSQSSQSSFSCGRIGVSRILAILIPILGCLVVSLTDVLVECGSTSSSSTLSLGRVMLFVAIVGMSPTYGFSGTVFIGIATGSALSLCMSPLILLFTDSDTNLTSAFLSRMLSWISLTTLLVLSHSISISIDRMWKESRWCSSLSIRAKRETDWERTRRFTLIRKLYPLEFRKFIDETITSLLSSSTTSTSLPLPQRFVRLETYRQSILLCWKPLERDLGVLFQQSSPQKIHRFVNEIWWYVSSVVSSYEGEGVRLIRCYQQRIVIGILHGNKGEEEREREEESSSSGLVLILIGMRLMEDLKELASEIFFRSNSSSSPSSSPSSSSSSSHYNSIKFRSVAGVLGPSSNVSLGLFGSLSVSTSPKLRPSNTKSVQWDIFGSSIIDLERILSISPEDFIVVSSELAKESEEFFQFVPLGIRSERVGGGLMGLDTKIGIIRTAIRQSEMGSGLGCYSSFGVNSRARAVFQRMMSPPSAFCSSNSTTTGSESSGSYNARSRRRHAGSSFGFVMDDLGLMMSQRRPTFAALMLGNKFGSPIVRENGNGNGSESESLAENGKGKSVWNRCLRALMVVNSEEEEEEEEEKEEELRGLFLPCCCFVPLETEFEFKELSLEKSPSRYSAPSFKVIISLFGSLILCLVSGFCIEWIGKSDVGSFPLFSVIVLAIFVAVLCGCNGLLSCLGVLGSPGLVSPKKRALLSIRSDGRWMRLATWFRFASVGFLSFLLAVVMLLILVFDGKVRLAGVLLTFVMLGFGSSPLPFCAVIVTIGCFAVCSACLMIVFSTLSATSVVLYHLLCCSASAMVSLWYSYGTRVRSICRNRAKELSKYSRRSLLLTISLLRSRLPLDIAKAIVNSEVRVFQETEMYRSLVICVISVQNFESLFEQDPQSALEFLADLHSTFDSIVFRLIGMCN